MEGPRQAPTSRERGHTLAEVCVVMGIIAAAAATAVPSLADAFETQRIKGVSSELASDLRMARMAAITRSQNVRFTLLGADGGSCYVVHTGNAGDCKCAGNRAAVCSGTAKQIKTVWLASEERIAVQSNSTSLLFDPALGTSTPAGTFRVIGAKQEVRHVVNVMGRVRSCVAQGSVWGYKAC